MRNTTQRVLGKSEVKRWLRRFPLVCGRNTQKNIIQLAVCAQVSFQKIVKVLHVQYHEAKYVNPVDRVRKISRFVCVDLFSDVSKTEIPTKTAFTCLQTNWRTFVNVCLFVCLSVCVCVATVQNLTLRAEPQRNEEPQLWTECWRFFYE